MERINRRQSRRRIRPLHPEITDNSLSSDHDPGSTTVKMEIMEDGEDEDELDEGDDDVDNNNSSSDDFSSSDEEDKVPKKKKKKMQRKCWSAKTRKTGNTPKRAPQLPAPVNLPVVNLKVIPMPVGRKASFTLKEKIDIIERLRGGESQSSVATSLRLNFSTIHRMWGKRDKFEEEAAKGNWEKRKCRKPQNADLDGLVLSWVEYMRAQGTPANGTQIKEQARILAKGLGEENFNASNGWLDKFKQRNKIVLPKARKHSKMLEQIIEKEQQQQRTSKRDRAGTDADDNDFDQGHWDEGMDFLPAYPESETETDPSPPVIARKSGTSVSQGSASKLKKTQANKKSSNEWLSRTWPILSDGYTTENIFFANEFGLFYRTTPENYKEVKGLSCCDGEHAKDRLSVLFGLNALGTERLKLVVVGSSQSPSSFGTDWSPRDQEKLPTEYWIHPKAFVTPDVISSWLSRWNAQMEGEGADGKRRKVLLIMSNSRVHQTVQDLCGSLSCIKIVLPSGSGSSVLRHLQNDIVAELKQLYKKLMLNKLIRKKACESQGDDGRIISVLEASRILQTAWMGMENSTIAEVFQKSGLSIIPEVGNPTSLEQKKKGEDKKSTLRALIQEARSVGLKFPKELNFQGFVDLEENLIAVDMSVGIFNSRSNPSDEDRPPCTSPPPSHHLLNSLDHLGDWAVANHSGDLAALHDAISTIQNFCGKNLPFNNQNLSITSAPPLLSRTASQSIHHKHSSQLQPQVPPNTSTSNLLPTIDPKSINTVSSSPPTSSSSSTVHPQQNTSSAYGMAFPIPVNNLTNFGNTSTISQQQLSYIVSNGQTGNVSLHGLSVAANLLQQQQHHNHNNMQNQYFDHRGQ